MPTPTYAESCMRIATRAGRLLALALGLLLPTTRSNAAPQEWSLHIASPAGEYPSDVAVDGAGGNFVVGQTTGDLGAVNQGSSDAFVARVSPAGTLQWLRQFGTPASEIGFGVTSDGSGGCFVTFGTMGDLVGPSAGGWDVVLARFDGAGTLLWMKQFGSDGSETRAFCAPDGAGGVYVAGDTTGSLGGPSVGGNDIWAMRFDAAGTLLWSRQFGSTDTDFLGDVGTDESGGVYLCGFTLGQLQASSAVGGDSFLGRYDASGQLLWLVQEGEPISVDHAKRLVADGSDAVFVTGTATGGFGGDPFGGYDVYVARYDGSGTREWIRKFGSTDNDETSGIARDGLGGLFAVGYTWGVVQGTSAGDQDAWMAQYRADGTKAWVQQMGTPGGDVALGACEAGAGHFVVVGGTEGDLFGVPVAGPSDTFVARFEGCAFDPPAAYCPGALNSTGAAAVLADQGSTSIGLNDLRFTVAGGPPGEKGIVIQGSQQAQNPFGNGTLCLGGTVQRLLPPVTLSAEGKGIHPVDFEDPTQPTAQITPGSTWYFQFWYRDSAAGIGDFNLSNGLSATFCP